MTAFSDIFIGGSHVENRLRSLDDIYVSRLPRSRRPAARHLRAPAARRRRELRRPFRCV